MTENQPRYLYNKFVTIISSDFGDHMGKYQFRPKMTKNIHQKYKIQDNDTKWTNLREIHPRYLHIKNDTILSCSLGEEDYKRPHGRNSSAVLLSMKENKDSEQVTNYMFYHMPFKQESHRRWQIPRHCLSACTCRYKCQYVNLYKKV